MPVDYSAMDTFCKRSTWNTGHASDQRAFVEALVKIVDHPEFSPGAMIEYIRSNHGEPIWPASADELEDALGSLEQQAFAVMYSRKPD